MSLEKRHLYLVEIELKGAKMSDNFSKIISLLAISQKIEGRKKLQKMVFILQQLGIEFDEKFSYHFYGPYSSELQFEIEYLTERDIINEERTNPYIYKPNIESGKPIKLDSSVEGFKEVIEHLNQQPAKLLEAVATIFYLVDYGYEDEEAFKKLEILKPDHDEYFSEARKMYNDLKKGSNF